MSSDLDNIQLKLSSNKFTIDEVKEILKALTAGDNTSNKIKVSYIVTNINHKNSVSNLTNSGKPKKYKFLEESGDYYISTTGTAFPKDEYLIETTEEVEELISYRLTNSWYNIHSMCYKGKSLGVNKTYKKDFINYLTTLIAVVDEYNNIK